MGSPSPWPKPIIVSRRYRVQTKLGAGGLGSVYLAHDEVEQRPVALKLIHVERVGTEGVEALQREFCATTSLRHPSIAAAYDFGYTDGERLPFYTREYVDGAPLEGGPPPTGVPAHEYLKPILDLLEALHYLHAHEILHLDIHPGNVIVPRDETGGSVLIDAGVMKPLWQAAVTPPLHIRSEVPPELRHRCDSPLGPPTDLYGVGRLLLYRLTGRFDGEARLPREIPGWGPRCTLELERIAHKAIQDDAPRRFSSARAFHDALSAVLGHEGNPAGPFEPGESTEGREAELAAIEDGLRQASSGGATGIWFEGPRGVGKSRLLTEARLRAQLRGMELVEARFFRGQAGEPSLARAIRLQLSGRKLPAWLEPMTKSHGGSTAERAERAAKAFFDESGPPVVFILDDIDQADRDSLQLVRSLLLAMDSRGEVGRGIAMFVASVEAFEREVPAARATVFQRRLRPLSLAAARDLLGKLLRPLQAPRNVLDALARLARGSPRRLRQTAKAAHVAWGESGVVPQTDLEWARFDSERPGPLPSLVDDSDTLRVCQTLAALERPATREEIEVGVELPRTVVRGALRRLQKREILTLFQERSARLYAFEDRTHARELLGVLSRASREKIHARLVGFLETRAGKDPRRLESLGFHALRAGRFSRARLLVRRVVGEMRALDAMGGAIRVLREASAHDRSPRWTLWCAEQLSSFHHEAGDHADGIAALTPIYESTATLNRGDSTRIRRRLGVHYHRVGKTEKALSLFQEAQALADPRRDVEELLFLDSELAELHTLRGEYDSAEAACQRGLGLLVRLPERRADFRGEMETLLRASMGHLLLRRMDLVAAATELAKAARGAVTFATTAVESLILNNLAIVYNQQNQFPKAARCYERAKRLLTRSGERSGLILIAANLSTLYAKMGKIEAAREHARLATELLAGHPGQRLEFFVLLSRGVLHQLLGEVSESMEAFERAIPLGRKLEDRQSLTYAYGYLAEAQIPCGHYAKARRTLKAGAASAATLGLGALTRMIRARRFLLETLLGRERAAHAALREIEGTPRTEGLLIEAWNDLLLGLGSCLLGDCQAAGENYERARSTFHATGVCYGERLADSGLLHVAILGGDPSEIWRRLGGVVSAQPAAHKLLNVLEPLLIAEAHFVLGDNDGTAESLRRAVAAIVGRPFLELDWRSEFLRASLSERRDDRSGARRHLHRAVHTKNLLSSSLSHPLRKTFLAQPRFKSLGDLTSRLEKWEVTPLTAAPRLARGRALGLVGRSDALWQVLETIEKLRDLELPVLITGETGTGKELVAKAIHKTSPRHAGRFSVLHCASLPQELFESELFGYEAGAFTGADESRPGLLELYAGGTLLLDEIDSLSLVTQSKLLQVLDRKVVRPLGGVHPRLVQVRFLVASSRDLGALVQAEAFRKELYYRIAGTEIQVPPLRARKGDIPDLVEHFLARHAQQLDRPTPRVSSAALGKLVAHDWPGNIRQLEATLIRALIECPGDGGIDTTVISRVLPEKAVGLFSEDFVAGRNLAELRDELERVYLTRLFRETEGNIPQMVEALGVRQASLYRWFKRLGVDVRSLRREI